MIYDDIGTYIYVYMYIIETGYTSLYRMTGKYTAIYSVENTVL